MTRSIKSLLSLTLTAALLTIGCIAFSGCIGIGSNSVRVLLAGVEEGIIARLWRGREAPRLFAGLDERGNLSQESMDRAVAAVRRMAEESRERGAERIHIFATSAARDAANGQTFMVEKERRDTVGYAYAQHGNDVYVILYTDILYENDDTETIHANYDALLQSVRFTK